MVKLFLAMQKLSSYYQSHKRKQNFFYNYFSEKDRFFSIIIMLKQMQN